MDAIDIRNTLSDLPLGKVRIYKRIKSTNDTALTWAANGAPDLSLVLADEQICGRGRGNKNWTTRPGVSLAFSMILYPSNGEVPIIQRFTALGALAVCRALESYVIHPEVKWPNDLLLKGKKCCGILTEASWIDGKIAYMVVGVGVNIATGSVPAPPDVDFPATSLEEATGRAFDRYRLLHAILKDFIYWRTLILSPAFLREWEKRLAYRGKEVIIQGELVGERRGIIEGLDIDGSLRLRSPDGKQFSVRAGLTSLALLV